MTTYNAATTLDTDDDTFKKAIVKANEEEAENTSYQEDMTSVGQLRNQDYAAFSDLTIGSGSS